RVAGHGHGRSIEIAVLLPGDQWGNCSGEEFPAHADAPAQLGGNAAPLPERAVVAIVRVPGIQIAPPLERKQPDVETIGLRQGHLARMRRPSARADGPPVWIRPAPEELWAYGRCAGELLDTGEVFGGAADRGRRKLRADGRRHGREEHRDCKEHRGRLAERTAASKNNVPPGMTLRLEQPGPSGS